LQDYLEKPFTKTGLVKWLKVKALELLSSSPSSTKKKKKIKFRAREAAQVVEQLSSKCDALSTEKN
jgi:hypothetical protein